MKPNHYNSKPVAPQGAKPPRESKTIAANTAIVAAVSFIPGVGPWVAANPEAAIALVGALNILLRCVSKNKIALWRDGK